MISEKYVIDLICERIASLGQDPTIEGIWVGYSDDPAPDIIGRAVTIIVKWKSGNRTDFYSDMTPEWLDDQEYNIDGHILGFADRAITGIKKRVKRERKLEAE